MSTALAVQKTEEQSLVKPANPEEEVLAVISAMRRVNLTADQQEQIANMRNRACGSFRRIVSKKFGLSDEQILDLGDGKIETLFNIVVNEALKSLWYYYLLHIFPITLMLISAMNEGWHPAFHLGRSINKLRVIGDRPMTGLDVRENIEAFVVHSQIPSRFFKRHPEDKNRLIARRKP